jgi:hypothetical protein
MTEWGLFCIEHQIPKFMLLLAIHDSKLDAGPGLGVTANSEIHINYGNKGNEVSWFGPYYYILIYIDHHELMKSGYRV